MKRIIWLIIVAVLTAALFYISRFWNYRFWGREGLFEIEALRPQGKLLGQWLRGTDLAPFELLIWAIGAFCLLSLVQKLYDLLSGPPK